MLCVIILAGLIAAAAPDPAVASSVQRWEVLAREYIELEGSVRSGSRTATEVFEKWSDTGTALAQSSPPVDAVRRRLESPDRADREMALAAMGVARVQDNDLMRLVLSRFTQSEPVEYREYAARALANISPHQVQVLGNELVAALSREANVMVIVAARPALTQLTRGQALRLLSALALVGGDGMRKLVRAMAAQREDGFVGELAQLLEQRGAISAAREVAGGGAAGTDPSSASSAQIHGRQ